MSSEIKYHDYEKKAREEMDVLKKHFKWSKLKELIHKHIGTLTTEHLKPLTYKKAWENIFIMHKGNRDPLWWKDMLKVIEAIKNEIGSESNLKAESLYQSLKTRSVHIDDRVRYGYPINQDTIIPKYFEASYRSKLAKLEFIPLPDWNEGVEAFLSNKINVAVRDFSTAVAYNSLMQGSKLYFWPFFSFAGYGIIIKPSAVLQFSKRHNLSYKTFKEMKPSFKTKFLEEQTYIVEKYTDFEWVLKKFCEINNCDAVIIEDKTEHCNNNDAKLEFLNNDSYTVFCTNPVHIVDLSKKGKFELIRQNGDINHKNFNGLIFTEEYYQKNHLIVQRLIKNWFDDIKPFKNEIKELAMNEQFRDDNYSPSYTVQNLIHDLNTATKSDLTLNDLPFLYEHSNHFYEDPTSAFDDFYLGFLNDPTVLKNYCEIALIQLGQPQDTWETLKDVLGDIKQNMLSFKK